MVKSTIEKGCLAIATRGDLTSLKPTIPKRNVKYDDRAIDTAAINISGSFFLDTNLKNKISKINKTPVSLVSSDIKRRNAIEIDVIQSNSSLKLNNKAEIPKKKKMGLPVDAI
jgi:hypothetical protein